MDENSKQDIRHTSLNCNVLQFLNSTLSFVCLIRQFHSNTADHAESISTVHFKGVLLSTLKDTIWDIFFRNRRKLRYLPTMNVSISRRQQPPHTIVILETKWERPFRNDHQFVPDKQNCHWGFSVANSDNFEKKYYGVCRTTSDNSSQIKSSMEQTSQFEISFC